MLETSFAELSPQPHEQSGFNDSRRRMYCGQKSMMWRGGLDFVCVEAFISINLSKLPRADFSVPIRLTCSKPVLDNFRLATIRPHTQSYLPAGWFLDFGI
jgi:hypothetical protein